MSRITEDECFAVTWHIRNLQTFLSCQDVDSKLTSPSWTTETTSGRAVSWRLVAYPTRGKVLFRLINIDEIWSPVKWEASIHPTYAKEQIETPSLRFHPVNFFIKIRNMLGFKSNSNASLTAVALECKMWYHEMKRGEVSIHSTVKTIKWLAKGHCFFKSIVMPYSYDYIIEQDNMRVNVALKRKLTPCGLSESDVALLFIDESFSFVFCRLLVDGETAKNNYTRNYNSSRSEWRGKLEIPYRDCDHELRLESTVAHHEVWQAQDQLVIADLPDADNVPRTVVGPLTVPSLKSKCAEVLNFELTADNVCDVLVLAFRLSDQDLMTTVVDFLLDNREVVSSDKWSELEEVNPRLAAKAAKMLVLKKGSQ